MNQLERDDAIRRAGIEIGLSDAHEKGYAGHAAENYAEVFAEGYVKAYEKGYGERDAYIFADACVEGFEQERINSIRIFCSTFRKLNLPENEIFKKCVNAYPGYEETIRKIMNE